MYSSSVELIVSDNANSSGTLVKVVVGAEVIRSVLMGLFAGAFRDRASSSKDARVPRARFIALGLLALISLLLPSYVAPFDLIRHVVSGFLLMGLFAWTAWPRDHAVGIALRKRIAAVRLYFQGQLQKERPDLDDRWYPYLIARGLSPEMDAWFEIVDGRRMGKEQKGRSSGSNSHADSASRRSDSSTSSSSSRSTRSQSSPTSSGARPSFSGDTKSRSGGGSAGGW